MKTGSPAILIIMLAILLTTKQAYAIHFLDILGLGGGDGNIAKIKYRLRENFFPTDVAWSEDGNYIASASSQSREIHIWDVKKNEIIQKLHVPAPPAGGTKSMTWTTNGKYLATCTGFGKLPFIIFSTETGVIVKKFSDKDEIRCGKITPSHDGKKIAIIESRNIYLFNTENFTILNKFEIPKNILYGINDASWLPDNQTIIIGSDGNYEKIDEGERKPVSRLFKININSQKILNNTIAYGAPYFSDITVVAASPDGRLIATGTRTGSGRDMQHLINASLHIFDAHKFSLLATPMDGPMDGSMPPDGAIYGLDFSSNGKYLIAGHLDEDNSSIHIFDTQSLKLIDTAHSSGGVRALAAQKHGILFAVASAQHIIIYELN